MDDQIVFEWHGGAHRVEEKNADWYWALGIVSTAAVIASVLFQNYLLALVIVAATFALVMQSAKKPQIHRFRITENGIGIDDIFFPFEDILSFSVIEYPATNAPPVLSFKTRRLLAPHVMIPIVGHDPVEIYEYCENYLEHQDHSRSVTEAISAWLRI